MKAEKWRRRLPKIFLALLIIQIPWFAAVDMIANATSIRTTATVIRLESQDANCTGDQPGVPDWTCDHSDRLYPVYEYYDEEGVRYELDDRFFGEYKENNPLAKLFLKQPGDQVTAYYSEDNPGGALFMSTPLAYTAWLIPIYASVPVLFVYAVWTLLPKLDKFTHSKKRP